MPRPLSAEFDRIAPCLRSARRLLFFSDFDGTLAPIQDQPTECFLDPAVRQTLSALAGQDRVAVGIVSGRELDDLRIRVGVMGISYAGNHGLEIEGPGFSFREPTAVNMAKELHGLAGNLSHAIKGFPGAWVQDKGLSASVHYRQVNPELVPHLLKLVRHVVDSSKHVKKIVLRSGKMVLEIRPAVDWHKGSAVCWLINKLSLRDESPLTLYIGDDNTDEDAFAALPGGITIRVGEKHATSAKYFVRSFEEVQGFMEGLLELRSSPEAKPGHRFSELMSAVYHRSR